MYNNIQKDLEKLMKKAKVQKITTISFEDYDQAYTQAIHDGSGFLLDETIDYNKYLSGNTMSDIKDLIYENSIFSYKYGIALEDEERVVNQLYTCDCGMLTGIENIDGWCDKCNTQVTRTKPKRTGWFALKNHKIIHPFIIYIMSVDRSPIKRKETKEKKAKTLIDVVQEEPEHQEEDTEKEELYTADDDDKLQEDESEKDESDDEEEVVKPRKRGRPKASEVEKRKRARTPKVNLASLKKNLTLLEALNQKKLDYQWEDLLNPSGEYLEKFIIKYLKNKRDLLFRYRDLWYQSHIVVISKNYRYITPQQLEVTGTNRIHLHTINKPYMNISQCVNILNNTVYDNAKTMNEDALITLHNELAEIGKSIFSDIGAHKKAHIRGEVYGKKYTFSGRLIIEIINDPNIDDFDCVQVPIEYFRATFVEDIINIGKQLKIPIKKLHDLIDAEYKITPEDKRILVEDIFPRVESPFVYINREPDIYVTSILGMRIHSLLDEMVMRIPSDILGATISDFDLSDFDRYIIA